MDEESTQSQFNQQSQEQESKPHTLGSDIGNSFEEVQDLVIGGYLLLGELAEGATTSLIVLQHLQDSVLKEQAE